MSGSAGHGSGGAVAGGETLGATAATVLRLAGEQALTTGRSFLDHGSLERACLAGGLAHDDVFTGLRALVAARLADMHFVPPSRVTLLRLTDGAIRRCLADARPDLADVRRRVVAALGDGSLDWKGGEPVDLAGAVAEPPLLVEVVMEDLRDEGRVVFSRATGGRLRVHRLD